jgi:hypothetical protein
MAPALSCATMHTRFKLSTLYGGATELLKASMVSSTATLRDFAGWLLHNRRISECHGTFEIVDAR